MKIVLKFTILAILISSFISCKLTRFAVHNSANIDDYKVFKTRKINNTETKFNFKKANEIKPFDTLSYTFKNSKKEYHKKEGFEKILEDNSTVAFIVVRNDSLIYEKYFNKYNRDSKVNSFSTAKSILSLLIGCAIDDGIINSIDDKVIKYIPELKENGFGEIKIKNLLQMNSGIDFKEVYSAFTDAGNLYYGRDLIKELKKLKIKYPVGTKFHYSSGDSQILGLVLTRALNDISLSTYLENRIWKPLGMDYSASWSLDDKGLEKAFCCINASAIDFAKIGRLYLNNGNWNGTQIVSKNWIEKTIEYDESIKINPEKYFYNYNWYLNPNGTFYTEGFKGQHIYVDKASNLVIVRLGEKFGEMNWPTFFEQLSKDYKLK
ncbi:serine hydrolase domain-containing protein [Formosa sp. 3Alg 14/1]|uniref:serine hydrolase domain-containing protein n=1 Tax=Formosa sp. 3Alg 14/1 TaxID=3382190 RepID=UPI0039BE0641